MKKIFKLKAMLSIAGIIAIAVVIGFSMTACEDGDDALSPPVHNHVWGDWKVTTAATCIAKGEQTRVCTLDAAHKETREIPIDTEAHDWELLEGTAPTCTEDGNGKEKCKICKREKNGVLSAIGHDWDIWVQTRAPTETSDGQEERTCKHDAAHKEINAIAALNHTHDWGNWSVITTATCTAQGERIRVCQLNAEHKDIEEIAIDQNAHNYQWQVTTTATYLAEGEEAEICLHNPSHKGNTHPIPQIPFTSIEDLKICLTSQPDNTAANPYKIKLNVGDLGDRYIDNNPYYYGVENTGSLGYLLKNNNNKKVFLDLSGSTFTSIGYAAFFDCTSLTSVVIPNSVTSIGDAAFSNCTGLTSVVIPNSVTSIGDYAFSNCTGLTSVTIPKSVTNIGGGLFVACTSLTAINVDAGNSTFSSQDGVLYNKAKTTLIAYPAGKTGNTFTIPNSVTSIGDAAFSNCTRLTSVTIPNSVTSIGYGAFDGCTSLTSVTIPNSVTSIGNFAFDGCTSLTSVTIGNGVTSIGYGAFYGCTSLTSVTIPNSVTSIGGGAFERCTSLASVTIGNGVTSIEYRAFSGCTGLTSVTIGSGVTSIEWWRTFYDCTSLAAINVDAGNSTFSSQDGILYNKAKTAIVFVPKKITGTINIPNSITSIKNSAFVDCTKITAINIGTVTSVTVINSDDTTYSNVGIISAIYSHGLTSLTAINIDAANTEYSSVDGVVYNKNKTTLIRYPEGKTGSTFTIPAGVTSIESGAFSDCTRLTAINVDSGNSAYISDNGVLYNKTKTTLVAYPAGKTGNTFTIPNSVTTIERRAFWGCTGLTSITIPNSVTVIGWNAFWDCKNLTSVTFATGSNIADANFGDYNFPEGSEGYGGNTLKDAYSTGKAGTYTRPVDGDTWSKR